MNVSYKILVCVIDPTGEIYIKYFISLEIDKNYILLFRNRNRSLMAIIQRFKTFNSLGETLKTMKIILAK